MRLISNKLGFVRVIIISIISIVILLTLFSLLGQYFNYSEGQQSQVTSAFNEITGGVDDEDFFEIYDREILSERPTYYTVSRDGFDIISGRIPSGELGGSESSFSSEFSSEYCSASKIQGIFSSNQQLARNLYNRHKDLFDNFVDKYPGMETEILLAILLIESRGSPFHSNKVDLDYGSRNPPTTRFECHIFNREMQAIAVDCTCSNPEVCNFQGSRVFSQELSETNFEAFTRAREINKQKAIFSSSFGFGQIMGMNYQRVGYSSLDDFYNAMFIEENQVRIFLNFLESNSNLIAALIDKDFSDAARFYNGNACCPESADPSDRYNVILECAYLNINNEELVS